MNTDPPDWLRPAIARWLSGESLAALGLTGADRLALSAIECDGVFGRIEAAANELIREALEELHAYDPADYGPGGKWAARQ